MIYLQRDCISGQSKGCWAAIQFGYTRLLFRHLWPRDHHAGAWLEVFLAAPAKYIEGYRLTHWGVYVRPWWRRRASGMAVGRGT